MKFICIFKVENPVKQCLSAVHYDGEEMNEYEGFFTRMSDPSWVQLFCSKNLLSLVKSAGTIEEMALEIFDMGAYMEERLLACESKLTQCRLDELFNVVESLGNGEDVVYACIFRSYPAKNIHSYLEIYALKPDSNFYVVTGGRICVPNSPANEGREMDEVRKNWKRVYDELNKK